MWNLTSQIANAVKWIMLKSPLPGLGLLFFSFFFPFISALQRELSRRNQQGRLLCKNPSSECSVGPRLRGGGPPGGGLRAVFAGRLFAQEFMRLRACSHDSHSQPTFNNHRVREMNCLDFPSVPVMARLFRAAVNTPLLLPICFVLLDFQPRDVWSYFLEASSH